MKGSDAVQKVNYQLLLDKVIADAALSEEKPSLLLHVCCAPCSSYVLEYLSAFFDITVFFYNPNITSESEYNYRVDEVHRLLSHMSVTEDIRFVEGKYDTSEFFRIAKGLESAPEGSERCFKCYRLRLRESAEFAKNNGFDYFTTTLSISPYKNAEKLNTIGGELAEEYGVKYLFSDFKKRNGYKRSIELSAEYDLYRQDYCGCIYSRLEMKRRKTDDFR